MTGQTKAIIWVLGVFVSGALFGGVVSYFAAPSLTPPALTELEQPEAAGPEEAAPAGPPAEPGEERRSFRPPQSDKRSGERRRGGQEMQRLARHLQLTPDQRAQLRQIFQENMRRLQAANQEHRARQHQLRADMMRSLRNILTSEQKERFDEFMRNRQQRRKRQPQERRPPQRRQQ